MSIKAEFFAPVLAWLDKGAPHTNDVGFNMGFVHGGSQDFAENPCGTACCIAGAVILFNKLEKQFPPYWWHTQLTYPLGEFLGMNYEQVDQLFYAGGAQLAEITPAEAAQAIRSMLETGEAQWT